MSHCSWQMGFLIEQQVYWILVPWTCPSGRINTDRWRTKGRIEIEPAGIFSRVSLCKSSLEAAHAVAKTKWSQLLPCANTNCILREHALGVVWACSKGWVWGEESATGHGRERSLPLPCIVWIKSLVCSPCRSTHSAHEGIVLRLGEVGDPRLCSRLGSCLFVSLLCIQSFSLWSLDWWSC